MIDKNDIKNLEKLSRLKIENSDMSFLMLDLENMVKFKEKLDNLDTQNIEPLYQISNNSIGFRSDEESNELSNKIALKNAPISNDSFFAVPKVK